MVMVLVLLLMMMDDPMRMLMPNTTILSHQML